MTLTRLAFFFLLTAVIHLPVLAQDSELNTNWKCIQASEIRDSGTTVSLSSYPVTGWQPAVVPGTVLTTLLANGKIPDPFYGMNNNKIPDIYTTGKARYTYWFVRDFKEAGVSGTDQVWLHFRGVNYGCDVFLNGKKLNAATHKGMFLRQTYNITAFLKNGMNRIAVIVYPPDAVGNPNGGQGGDGTIARNVSHQYVTGWDWIQPVRDRNTGIWDKVFIERTKAVRILDAHIVTQVPGLRFPEGKQAPAMIKVSAALENATAVSVTGELRYTLNGVPVSKKITIPSFTTRVVALDDLQLQDPKLWWPNQYGPQDLYHLKLIFVTADGIISDEDTLNFGIREIKASWNEATGSQQVSVNGQKIFIKGGNWIISDEMLRFSPTRYDAEIRFHRDMNLNLIRVWGGAITERPEFYEACDRYGLLVMQDLWGSGDCNGRWLDPKKLDDQWTRRKYPDDHTLFLASVADQVKMLRNHASLAIWCGGNEIGLADDLFHPVKDSILPALDGTRWFIDYSNSDSMSYNFIGGGSDGPYGIQPVKAFFSARTFPFNSEVGSVGVGDYESLKRFLPEENLHPPVERSGQEDVTDSVWNYHKYISYGQFLKPYGDPTDIRDFTRKAQLVNYDQYRSLIEGFSAHMWDWYTGVIIWKTQNPWTAMRGQMYDYYLDPNACLYGLHTAGEPLHVLFNAADSSVMIVNNRFQPVKNVMLQVKYYTMAGKESLLTQVFTEIGPTNTKKSLFIGSELRDAGKNEGVFLVLRLLDASKQILSDNLYWTADAQGNYNGLQILKPSELQAKAKSVGKGKLEISLTNPAGGPVAFFNRISLTDPKSGNRLLPVFYSDNYVSILPGEQKIVAVDYTPGDDRQLPGVKISGWNFQEQMIPISK